MNKINKKYNTTLESEIEGGRGGGWGGEVEIARVGWKNFEKLISGRGDWNCREVEFLKDFFREQTGIFTNKKNLI